MEVLLTVCSQARLTEIATGFYSARYSIPIYVGFEISEDYLLVIWSIITNLEPHPFPKGLKCNGLCG